MVENRASSGSGILGMQCPVCRVNLVMSDRQGIEIDYCPQCRGVWLDRGELDKIIEASVRSNSGYADDGRSRHSREAEHRRDSDHGHRDDRGRGHGDGHRYDDDRGHGRNSSHGSFLRRLFD
ncbi:TFIIB-type zinc ribbon-containing protein [Aminobacter sp. Piv2-1]|uniref:TFIIB-type zinc ribbon-containing protein n=1 Tax=Aminobacter sp. Piv2-1 TaxID=3031122 RepID=UPI0030A5A1A3